MITTNGSNINGSGTPGVDEAWEGLHMEQSSHITSRINERRD